MRTRRILGAAACASLLLTVTACGDDDDDTATATTTTVEAEGPTEIEVTLTEDGFDGLPSELPAGLVEITLVNDSGGYASLDISRVTEGTTEDEFVEGLAPLFEGGEFPDFFLDNAGVEAEDGETQTSLIVLHEGEHIVWWDASSGDGGEEDDGTDTETETETETVTETDTETETETDTGDDGDDTTTSTTAADETTTTTVAGEEEGASAAGQPEGTLTAVAAEDDETEDDTEDETVTEDGDEDEGPSAPSIVTAQLTVTAGDDSAELPEADGEIVATDYEFEATLDGPGTINFRNDGPQQFHHAVVMDFGTNDPEAVEEAFPTILESEGDPSSLPDVDIDLDEVNFDFAGSGVFGTDGSGTFEADITPGNTYVLVCFIQDRTGGPPHAIAYDMWDVVQAGGDTDSTTTTDG